jgi:hypothetical protein
MWLLLGRDDAELCHLWPDVDDPDLRGSAVAETEDEDLVVGDGCAGFKDPV